MSEKRTFNHGDREARHRKACERLGTESPRCLLCAEHNPHAVELHHVAGRAYDDACIPLCMNHHARASDLQKDHPPKIEGGANPLEGLGHILLGLGDLAEIAAEDLRDPVLADFLMYLRLKLKEVGLLLIQLAQRAPQMDFGIAS